MDKYDVAVKNGYLVIPKVGIMKADIGIKDEKVAAISRRLMLKQLYALSMLQVNMFFQGQSIPISISGFLDRCTKTL